MDNPIIIPPAPVTVALTRPQAIAIDRLAHVGRPFDKMAASRLDVALGMFNWLLNVGLLATCNRDGGSSDFKPGDKEFYRVTDLGYKSFNKWMEK
jgi:hypothetical protein